jgi:hypothetical protein
MKRRVETDALDMTLFLKQFHIFLHLLARKNGEAFTASRSVLDTDPIGSALLLVGWFRIQIQVGKK